MNSIAAPDNASPVQETASMLLLKKTLDAQQNAMKQLMESLPSIKDQSVGRNVDIFA